MSQNIPFLFGVGGQPVPIQPPPHQQHQPPQQTTPSLAQQSPHGQHAPPPQAQQNAAIPGISADLAEVLRTMPPAHMIALLQGFRSGQLTLPEVPVNPQPAHIPQSVHLATPAVAGQPIAPTASSQPNGAAQQDVDMDKEEGELDEGEEAEPVRERDFLRPPPTGPRKRSPSPREHQIHAEPGRRASIQTPPRVTKARKLSQGAQGGRPGASPGSLRRTTNGHGNSRRTVDSGAAARGFVLQMHNAGYTFEQLAQEIPNKKALRRMYEAPDLPIPTQTTGAPVNGMAAPLRPPQLDGAGSQATSTAATEARTVSMTKRPPRAKPVAPTDRAEYLAKLAAARTSKAKATTAPSRTTGLVEQPPAAANMTNAPVQAQVTQQPVTPPVAPKQVNQPPAKSAIKTELVKQKLEKLKAEQAAKVNAAQASSDTPIASSPLAKPTTAAQTPVPQPAAHAQFNKPTLLSPQTIATNTALLLTPVQTVQPTPAPPAPLQTLLSPAPPTPGRLFSSLPGLFIASPPVQPSPSVQQTPTGAVAASTSKPVPLPSMTQHPASSATVSALAPKPAPPVTSAQHTASFASSRNFAPSPIASPGPLKVTRKRPVAADFDAEIPASSAPSARKRPFSFGQSRSNSENERLVIEVSEDEDEDDDMDLDYTPVEAPGKVNARQHHSRPSGPLPGFPPKPVTASAPGTPLAVIPRNAAEIAAHEKRIAEMNSKIAKMEAQHSAKKMNRKPTVAAPKETATASGNATSVLTTGARLTVDTGFNEPLKQASPQVAASAKSSSAAPESSLSAAAVARNQEKARLDQRFKELQKQIARHNGAVASPVPGFPLKATPAMSIAAAKGEQRLEEITDTNVPATTSGDVGAAATAGESDSADSGEESELYGKDVVTEPKQPESATLDVPADDGQIGSQATTVTGTSQQDADVEGSTAATGVASLHVAPASNVVNVGSKPLAAPEEGTAVAFEAVVVPVDDVDMDVDSSEDDEDEGDDDLDQSHQFLRPETTMSSTAGPADSDIQDVPAADNEWADDDSSSASSTNTEDSALERADRDATEAEIEDMEDEYEPTPTVDVTAVDEEDYEPTPVDSENMTTEVPEEAVTAAISDVKPAATLTDHLEIADDLAPELQAPKAEQVILQDQDGKALKTYYHPYESALAQFKDYRYHPDYLDTVSGGYKSMTYSHNIDPTKPLCQTEAAGGECDDRKCENQHFRSMSLTDNDLLKVLGTDRTPTSTPESRARWNTGLAAVVKQLRNTKQGKDAKAIAARIVQYRRDFVDDATKVLNLD